MASSQEDQLGTKTSPSSIMNWLWTTTDDKTALAKTMIQILKREGRWPGAEAPVMLENEADRGHAPSLKRRRQDTGDPKRLELVGAERCNNTQCVGEVNELAKKLKAQEKENKRIKEQHLMDLQSVLKTVVYAKDKFSMMSALEKDVFTYSAVQRILESLIPITMQIPPCRFSLANNQMTFADSWDSPNAKPDGLGEVCMTLAMNLRLPDKNTPWDAMENSEQLIWLQAGLGGGGWGQEAIHMHDYDDDEIDMGFQLVYLLMKRTLDSDMSSCAAAIWNMAAANLYQRDQPCYLKMLNAKMQERFAANPTTFVKMCILERITLIWCQALIKPAQGTSQNSFRETLLRTPGARELYDEFCSNGHRCKNMLDILERSARYIQEEEKAILLQFSSPVSISDFCKKKVRMSLLGSGNRLTGEYMWIEQRSNFRCFSTSQVEFLRNGLDVSFHKDFHATGKLIVRPRSNTVDMPWFEVPEEAMTYVVGEINHKIQVEGRKTRTIGRKRHDHLSGGKHER